MRALIKDEHFPYFEKVGASVKFRSGEYIFRRGELATDIYLIKSGRVLVSTTTESGKELVYDVLKKGHLFGDGSFLAYYYREVDMIAVTDVELIICKTADLIPLLAENTDLMVLLFQYMTEENNRLTHFITRLMKYNGEQKVIDLILTTAGENQSIPYTHSDIATGLGMNRVTVSRIMKKLKDQGLIDYEYGIVTICDRDAMERILRDD